MNKEIKSLKSSLPPLKKRIYELSKHKGQSKNDDFLREDLIKQIEETERRKLLQKDLEYLKEKGTNTIDRKETTDKKDKLVCPSCNSPYDYSSGFSRCRCN